MELASAILGSFCIDLSASAIKQEPSGRTCASKYQRVTVNKMFASERVAIELVSAIHVFGSVWDFHLFVNVC
jgi:isopropylmalate/homocitrate/citramalate synthase